MMAEIRDWLGGVALLVSLGGTAWAWISSPARAAAAKADKAAEGLEKLDARVDLIDERVARVEAELAHLPDKSQMHAMQIELTELRGELRVLTERLAPLAAITARMQDYLMEAGRK